MYKIFGFLKEQFELLKDLKIYVNKDSIQATYYTI